MDQNSWSRSYDLLPIMLETLLSGSIVTIQIAVGSFLVALCAGIVCSIFNNMNYRVFKVLVRVYVEVFRGLPVLVVLFVIYFGLAQNGIRLSPMPAAIIGFGLYGGAYVAEIMRAAIESVHRGVIEAGYMIGLTRIQVLRYVVIPDATKVILPPLGNFAIGLLKDTALASAVAAPELTFNARVLVSQTYLSMQIYVGVAIMYLAMSVPLIHTVRLLELRSRRGGN